MKFDNGSVTNFHQGVQSLWRGGLSHNLLEDFNNDRKGWGNKVRMAKKMNFQSHSQRYHHDIQILGRFTQYLTRLRIDGNCFTGLS